MGFEFMAIHTQSEQHTTLLLSRHHTKVDSIIVNMYFAGKLKENDDKK